VSTLEFDAVILAGGRATRMGGADKPALLVGNDPMVVSVARAAAGAGAGRLIIVGPRREGPVQEALAAAGTRTPAPTDPLASAAGVGPANEAGVAGLADGAGIPGVPGVPAVLRMVREEPAGGGPVAALRSGLAEVTAPWLVLLAADLPFLRARQLTELLSRALATGRAGALIADGDGRPQWLAGCWQADVLRAALRGYRDGSLHGLLAPLDPVLMPATGDNAGPAPWLDCDTPDELAAARQAWQRHWPVAGGWGAGAGGAGDGAAGGPGSSGAGTGGRF
jgi:molybdopterin-guanine dinucleotide biosynthesis protein A